MSDTLPISKIRTDGGTQPRAAITPMQVFDDCTLLGMTDEWKQRIEASCPLESGYFPFIDFDPELGWVYHTLLTPDGAKSQKQIASRFVQRRLSRPEGVIEDALFDRLIAAGSNPVRQVPCLAGIADIVTADAVYEVKAVLSRDSLFKAIGQVLLYRQAINPSLRAVIVGKNPEPNMRHFAEFMGVEILEDVQ